MQGGHKLVVVKEWYIICSYTAIHDSTHNYNITKHTNLNCLQMLDVAALPYSANSLLINYFLPYVCEHNNGVRYCIFINISSECLSMK